MEQIDQQGQESYPTRYIIFENGFVIANILLGAFGMVQVKWLNIPVLSILYFLFIAYMLVFALRKHLCTQCWYYGKACHCGWGKMAAALFEKGAGSRKTGGILAGITWGVLMLLPIMVMGFSLYTDFSARLLIIFTLFVLVTIVNNILHIKDCRHCKMRFICPGSAARSA
jgi:hypothetical protein